MPDNSALSFTWKPSPRVAAMRSLIVGVGKYKKRHQKTTASADHGVLNPTQLNSGQYKLKIVEFFHTIAINPFCRMKL